MRAPAAIVAEITWRWIFGIALWAILYYSFREYFASVEISSAEYNLLRSLEPYTWIAISARVVVAILTGLQVIGPIIVPAIAILWVALATIGRAATVRALASAEPSTNWVSTTMLHLIRAVLVLVSVLAFFGCGILINGLVGDPSKSFGPTFLLASISLLAIAVLWSVVNWFVSFAAIFTVRDHAGLFRSFREVADLYNGCSDSLYSSAFWFGLLRTVAIAIATILSLIPIARLGAVHPRVAIVFVVVISLGYFAIADGLNLWRLATYISLSEPEPVVPVAEARQLPIQPSSESVLPSAPTEPATEPPMELPGEPNALSDRLID